MHKNEVKRDDERAELRWLREKAILVWARLMEVKVMLMVGEIVGT